MSMGGGHLEGAHALQARIKAVGNVDGRVGSRLLRGWQMQTVYLAKKLVPVKTRNLSRTIHPGRLDGHEGATVVASAAYARYVEEGTRPHIIKPVRARVLAWGGARRLTGSLRTGARPTAFARIVHHPGSRPKPFLRPAAVQAMQELKMTDTFVVAWNEAA